MDRLCRGTFAKCAPAEVAGVALVAVGGFGRGELAPHSDLDVVLVHLPEQAAGADPIAEQLWYPLWDSGHRLDHSVRSVPEMLDAAATDLKVALGLLDLRHLAGDPHLSLRLRSELLAGWRRGARSRVPELATLNRRRHELLGEIAHAAVPDLKEGQGGLRDACVLKALEATWLVDVPHTALEHSRQTLLDVRDAVHALTGRPQDRISPELWEPLSEALGLPDALAAQVQVRTAARRIGHLSRLTWRRIEAYLARPAHTAGPRRPALQPIGPGLAVSAGEVVLQAGTRPAADASLLLRAAAEAAERDLVLNPATAARLLRECPPLSEPWVEPAREALVRLLASGRGLLSVWETLEETGAVTRLIPEWESIRTLPHASVIHRWTVDRHVIETCIGAAARIRDVSRPDVLVVAALLHDIGKGVPGDHSRTGEPVARRVAARWGFDEEAVDRIGSLVRHHLLLGELTGTHDPDDPTTAQRVADAVGDTDGLDLLCALTAADAEAVSAQAWTPWRERLTQHLVDRVRGWLMHGTLPSPGVPVLPQDAVDGWTVVEVEADGSEPEPVHLVRVSSPDRVGLAADVAALLAMARARVVQARMWTLSGAAGSIGVSEWRVAGPELDPAVLRTRFSAIMMGEGLPAGRAWRPRPGDLPAVVELVPDSPGPDPGRALRVRAADRPGLVHRILDALAGQGVSVSLATLTSHGPQAVDVFHLVEPGAVRLTDARAASAAHAVRAALAG